MNPRTLILAGAFLLLFAFNVAKVVSVYTGMHGQMITCESDVKELKRIVDSQCDGPTVGTLLACLDRAESCQFSQFR